MAEPIEERTHLREPRGIAELWFAVLAGPLAWMLGLNAEYGLVRVACARADMLPLHLVSLATLLLALSGLWVSWRLWQRTGARWPGEGGGTLERGRFMAVLGLMNGVLFALTIGAQWVSNLFLHPCAAI